MDLWTAILDILILLSAAMVLGGICERLRQSAILGYLLAGTLLGPNALDWMPNHQAVSAIAELGVALLLFTIGLEFSWRRLRTIGAIALGGGTLQVLLTTILSAGVCVILGLGGHPSLAVGAMIALSSTACVLRLLMNRAEIDSVHGRNAMGILLLQDVAVVPLVLMITVLAGGGSLAKIVWEMLWSLGVVVLFVAASYLLFNYLAPLLFGAKEAARNRELPILLAIVTAVGAAWTAHRIGLSPSIGAFIAGLLLAGSPFATQIRADVAPLRTLFVTLFFSSIGMLADPAWALNHWVMVTSVVAAIVFGKTVITCGVLCLFRSILGNAIATGICLAQVGEFSFLLAEIARYEGLINDDLFKLIISATIATLFLTPYLVAAAPYLMTTVSRFSTHRPRKLIPADEMSTQPHVDISGHAMIVGFGPAGQRVAEALMKQHKSIVVVVELNPRSAAIAQSYGLQTYIGDATRAEVLEQLRVATARIVAVTVPDPGTSRRIIEQVRSLSTETRIIVRARYHVHRWQLAFAGAQVIVDEEEQVGMRIASEVQKELSSVGGEPDPVNYIK
ncbi:MAG: cation:proton antiporter [Planctomycetota bacterium]|nr:MAG: cation:proton antiporter [Planctomycetota bacterium]